MPEGGFPYLLGTVYPLYFWAKTSYSKYMIKNETTIKKTVSNLYSGEVVTAGYIRGQRNFTDQNKFVGFKVGDQVFSNLKLAKQAFGVSNLRDLEFEADRLALSN